MESETRKKLLISVMILLLACLVIAGFLVSNRPSAAPEDMVWIEGGAFQMGSDRGMPDEFPSHTVELDGFWIDQYEVTNADFQEFVTATGYVTYSEQVKDSLVFESPQQNSLSGLGPLDWWQLVEQADWRHPQGPEDTIENKLDHPVVHVTYDDALTYCNWAGKTLPTEAQFEYAARGGREGAIYTWGNQPRHLTEPMVNNWQGTFPIENRVDDGYATTAPVGSFEPNDFALFDITGNVWEWVSDWYHPRYYEMSPLKNPQGVEEEQSIDPAEPGLAKRSIRGGSFLCSDNYCLGIRVSARMPAHPDSSTNHTGFRCVANPSWVERLPIW